MVEVGELFYSSAIANFRMLFIMGAGALLVLFGVNLCLKSLLFSSF